MSRNTSPDVLFNLVMMMRTRSQKSVLLTESEADSELYQKFVSSERCLVRGADSRDGVISMLERFSRCRLGGCVGIVDADCDYVLGRPRPLPNVFRTDMTDKETTIIDSPAFDLFCAALNSAKEPEELRRKLYEAALPLGAIRRNSVRSGLPLDFKSICLKDFIDFKFRCDVGKCCEVVVASNLHLNITTSTLKSFVEDKSLTLLPLAKVVRGHDLVSILELASGAIFGRYISTRELDYELAKAYSMEHFRETTTYGDLFEWEQTVLPRHGLFP